MARTSPRSQVAVAPRCCDWLRMKSRQPTSAVDRSLPSRESHRVRRNRWLRLPQVVKLTSISCVLLHSLSSGAPIKPVSMIQTSTVVTGLHYGMRTGHSLAVLVHGKSLQPSSTCWRESLKQAMPKSARRHHLSPAQVSSILV